MSTGAICNSIMNGSAKVCRQYAGHPGKCKAQASASSGEWLWKTADSDARLVEWCGDRYIAFRDGALHVVFDDSPDITQNARTHCPSCDGYGFHRDGCAIVELLGRSEYPAVSEGGDGASRFGA